MIVFGGDYEHTLGMHAVHPVIGDIDYQPRALSELYRMILSHGQFEASEFSLSNHIMYRDLKDDWLTAIPVFPSRVFRHSSVFVRRDSDIQDFRQLVGKKVGISEYTMTAAVWTRGHMLDDYGVHWSDIKWVSRMDKRFPPPREVNIVSSSENLEDLLAAGTIDALLMPRPQDLRLPSDRRRFRHLLNDVRSVERSFYERTGIYPIMHTVVEHRDALAQWPAAPEAIFDLYAAGKHNAFQRRLGATFMPWAERHWEDTAALFANDFLPYGLTDANRLTIETLCRYLHEQRLIEQKVDDIEVLFAPNSASRPRH